MSKAKRTCECCGGAGVTPPPGIPSACCFCGGTGLVPAMDAKERSK